MPPVTAGGGQKNDFILINELARQKKANRKKAAVAAFLRIQGTIPGSGKQAILPPVVVTIAGFAITCRCLELISRICINYSLEQSSATL